MAYFTDQVGSPTVLTFLYGLGDDFLQAVFHYQGKWFIMGQTGHGFPHQVCLGNRYNWLPLSSKVLDEQRRQAENWSNVICLHRTKLRLSKDCRGQKIY
jgi:hypothetical protein